MNRQESTILNGLVYSRKGDGLYFYNEDLTYLHLIRQFITRETHLNLSFAKEIITDSKYPESGHIWFDPVFVEPQCFEDGEGYNHYLGDINYGKKALLQMIHDYRYLEALPQIKQILRWGTSKMKHYVLRELSDFPRKTVNRIIAETFPKQRNDPNINDYLHYVSTYPDAIFDRHLTEAYDTHQLCQWDNLQEYELLRHTLSGVLYACGGIYTIESLGTIEKGLLCEYEVIIRLATVNLHRWLEGIVVLKNPDKKLIKKAIEISEKYNMYKILKKGAW